MRLSHPHPHPGAPRSGLEGDLQSPRGRLEVSFEARLRLAPQDEGVGGIAANTGSASFVARLPMRSLFAYGFGFFMAAISNVSHACDLMKALFEKWPTVKSLAQPIEFTTRDGLQLAVIKSGVETYSEAGKCVAYFQVEAKDRRPNGSFSGAEGMRLLESIKFASEKFLVENLRKSCEPERILICYWLDKNWGCSPDYLYALEDGTFRHRPFELCAP